MADRRGHAVSAARRVRRSHSRRRAGARAHDRQLHTVRGADRHPVLVSRGGPARRGVPLRRARRMTPWALAAGDFTPQGGMDRANHALARYLAMSGRDGPLVAHPGWPALASLPGVT